MNNAAFIDEVMKGYGRAYIGEQFKITEKSVTQKIRYLRKAGKLPSAEEMENLQKKRIKKFISEGKTIPEIASILHITTRQLKCQMTKLQIVVTKQKMTKTEFVNYMLMQRGMA